MSLIHSGVAHDENPPGRGSGRYGWGTGANPFQHQFDFLSEIDKLKEKGLTENQIAKMLIGDKATTTQLRARITIAKNDIKKGQVFRAKELYDKYGNYSEVGRMMDVSEGTVRGWLKPVMEERLDRYTETANMLKAAIDKKGMINISKHAEHYLGCTQYTKDVAVSMLEEEGYVKGWFQVEEPGTGKMMTITALAPPGTTRSEIYKNRFNVQPIQTFTPDEGKTWWTPEFPESLDSKRVYIRYAEDGGTLKDGVIELRKGVEDLSLDGSLYAQVRIAVDGTNYMKGMAIYSDDIPDGYDVVYNTNKKRGVPAIDKNAVYNPENDTWSGKEVLKRMKVNKETGEVDQENPFGALIKAPKEVDGVIMPGGQRHYIDENGNEKLSPINKLRDEGDWDSWSRNLASQFLSKQPINLIHQQIDASIQSKREEFEEIMNLTNPVVKKKLLGTFADDCDATAVELSVQGFKNQAFQVLLPVPDLKKDEIYAPNYDNGDTVALVRYPHGGIFEIPILRVNNNSKPAKSIMEGAMDAVGINPEVAEQLSGADFDGDTALVIPIASNNLNVKSRPYLDSLKNFDNKALYKLPDDAPKVTQQTMEIEMGKVTNLINDMTVGGADFDEIARAVKHSMVVIDAKKHHLDYQQSARDYKINDLKREYQGTNPKTGQPAGASTILSKASSKVRIDERKEVNRVTDMTPEEYEMWKEGKKIYHPTGNKIKVKIDDPADMTPDELQLYNSGRKVYRVTNKPRQMEEYRMNLTDDATELVRDRNNPKEMAYANYANELKRMGEEARKEYRSIRATPVDQEAKKTYATEVESLLSKLRTAEMNNPREQIATVMANAMFSERLASNPEMDREHRQREKNLAMTRARALVGAGKEPINITDKEWDAIQANAISTDRLTRIVNNSNLDALKQRATPRDSSNSKDSLTTFQLNMIRSMGNSGMYTQKQIADKFGVSASVISQILKSAA